MFIARTISRHSILAAAAQGFVLGAFVQGVAVQGRAFSGGWLDWLTPFTVLTSAGLTLGYGLLGAAWLIGKTEGDLQRKARRWSRMLSVAIAVAMVLVCIATVAVNASVRARWGVSTVAPDWARLLPISPAPIITGAALVFLFLSAGSQKSRLAPFLCAAAAFMAGFAGLTISIAPYVVPYRITLWQAAAQGNALAFMLVGVVIMLPVILGYTAFVYWAFRGKVSAEHGYP